jgi:hypothetical protein
MPESVIPFAVPFNGEEGKGRESLPGTKRLFPRLCFNAVMLQ